MEVIHTFIDYSVNDQASIFILKTEELSAIAVCGTELEASFIYRPNHLFHFGETLHCSVKIIVSLRICS